MASDSETNIYHKKAVVLMDRQSDGDKSRPVIAAKGHGYKAETILDIAFANGIKVRQDKELTDLLDLFKVESPIPLEALHAVSLILERVYAANRDCESSEPIE